MEIKTRKERGLYPRWEVVQDGSYPVITYFDGPDLSSTEFCLQKRESTFTGEDLAERLNRLLEEDMKRDIGEGYHEPSLRWTLEDGDNILPTDEFFHKRHGWHPFSLLILDRHEWFPFMQGLYAAGGVVRRADPAPSKGPWFTKPRSHAK